MLVLASIAFILVLLFMFDSARLLVPIHGIIYVLVLFILALSLRDSAI